MTFPTEFNTQTKTIGDSNIKHPIYTFTVNLDRLLSEKIGPNTNLRDTSILHPDMYTGSADLGRSSSMNHANGNSSLLPGFLRGENIIVNNDGTITAYGNKALYLKKTFADVANPCLTVTSTRTYADASDTFVITATGGVSCAGSATIEFTDN